MSPDDRVVAVTARHAGADVTVTVPVPSSTFGDVVVAFANELGLSMSTTRLHGATKKWCAPSGVATSTSTWDSSRETWRASRASRAVRASEIFHERCGDTPSTLERCDEA